MLQFLDQLLSYIAPHECITCGVEGDLLCVTCLPLIPDIQPQCYRCHRTDSANKTCKNCKRNSPLESVYIRSIYEGVAEELVKTLKFNRAIAAADTIATSLAAQFATELSQDSCIVPVPTASSRVRKRGYDQSLVIAKILAKKTKLPYESLLVRSGQSRQVDSSRSQRFSQLQHAFIAKQMHKPREVILVDDVLTTGATLESAARALKAAGVKKIQAVVFARAE